MSYRRPRDLSDEELRAEAEELREELLEADRIAAPYMAYMWLRMALDDLEGEEIDDINSYPN